MMRVFLFVVMMLTSAEPLAASDDGVTAFLEGFVAKNAKQELNFFYVSLPKKGQHSDYVWIYWMTGNTLLSVDVPTERQTDYYWWEYKAKISLDSDVVPTQEDIQGSTYLCESIFVQDLLKQCLNGGRKIIVRKTMSNHVAEPASPSRGSSP